MNHTQCPRCHATLEQTYFGYECESECGYSILAKEFGSNFSESEIIEITISDTSPPQKYTIIINNTTTIVFQECAKILKITYILPYDITSDRLKRILLFS
jgi:DNA-directed RNA polymerase subunit RPC12/RpoP